MIDSLFNLLFLCPHRKITFPLTPRRKGSGSPAVSRRGKTYVVCLDCGKEFPYNWEELRIEPASATGDQTVGARMRKIVMSWLGPLLRSGATDRSPTVPVKSDL